VRAIALLTLSFVLGCGNEGAVVAFVRTGADASSGVALVDAAPEDATSLDAGVTDAAAGADADAALGPFSAAIAIDAVDDPDANNTDPTVTSDLRELYFISDRSGNLDIWLSQRDTPDAGWGAPTAVAELNTRMPEQSPGISFDGLTLWFTRSVMGQQQPQIWVTTRAAIGDTWSSPTAVAELDDAGTQLSPKVDEDALLMVFDSTRSGSREVYATTRPNMQSQWGPAALVPGLPPDAVDPFVASRGLALWFVSSPSGNEDLFMATRPSTVAAFGTATPLSELNTPAAESDPALSPDFRYIVFSSDRSGTMQLYEASR
jgi:Tol biopolymer transport system component